jgi:hypothetical protein
MKRQVADDDVRCSGQWVFQEVNLDDVGAGCSARCEPCGSTGVDLDGRQGATELLQRTCERAIACADFDDGAIGACDGLHDGVDDAAIVKEVLAKLVPARMRVCHNNSASSWNKLLRRRMCRP